MEQTPCAETDRGIKRLLDKRLLLMASNACVVSAGFLMSLFLVIPFRTATSQILVRSHHMQNSDKQVKH